MAGASRPKISIGMPVFNGARYLRPVVVSHLRQTFRDFELIISDDASTDETRAICEQFAADDARIRYVRAMENGGAARNFNRVFELALGDYFKWSAQDDLLAPTYLEQCLEVLEARPEVVLCHSLSNIVDLRPLEFGAVDAIDLPILEQYDLSRIHTDADRATARFGARVRGGRCIELYGVIRCDAITRLNRAGRRSPPGRISVAGPFRPFVGADRAVLAELAIEGKFACVRDPLFYNGHHSGRGSASGRSSFERLAFYQPLKEGRRSLPTCSLLASYFNIVHRRLPVPMHRLVCYGHILTALMKRWNIARLMFELSNAASPRLGRLIATAYLRLRPVRPRDRIITIPLSFTQDATESVNSSNLHGSHAASGHGASGRSRRPL